MSVYSSLFGDCVVCMSSVGSLVEDIILIVSNKKEKDLQIKATK